MKYFKLKPVHFCIFMSLYMNIEVFVRAIYGELVGFKGIKYCSLMGDTSIYMGILGGFLAVIIAYLLDNDKYFNLRVWQKLLIGGCIITFAELLCGLVCNVWLDMNIWYYTGINFMHQISLITSLEWTFIVTPMIIALDSYLTYWIYDEDKPISLLKIYKNLVTLK